MANLDQSEAFASIRNEFPTFEWPERRRKKKPEEEISDEQRGSRPSAAQQYDDQVAATLDRVLSEHSFSSGANTGLGGESTNEPPSPQTRRRDTEGTRGNESTIFRDDPYSELSTPSNEPRYNLSVPLDSALSKEISEGASLMTGGPGGAGISGQDVASEGTARDRTLTLGIGGGESLSITVTDGQQAITGDDGNPLAAGEKVAGTAMTASTANKILNGDNETTKRYQDISWAEDLTVDSAVQNLDHYQDLTSALRDMGYSPSGGSALFGDALDDMVSAYEIDHGIPEEGTFSGRMQERTLNSIKDDINTMHQVQQDLLK